MAKGAAEIYLLIWIKKDLTSVFFILRPGFFQFLVKVPKIFLMRGAIVHTRKSAKNFPRASVIVYTRTWPFLPEGHAAAGDIFWGYYIFKSIWYHFQQNYDPEFLH